ncbi:hypothetical protein [Pyxidicoccus xibeiensis]|uniref:hypothetical protein n=1 Tax=Pyxidicoccus xibeiensis TaxID=2906759 RepID=UPI0020A749B8|nr:hypothetical protein [Pyxidicoccus xibeiensis]MCP3136892.1 hypothetical protein [Pyxidicoccus xibeiensis]
MKLLESHDLGVQDRLRLSLEGAFDPRAPLERELDPFFEALEAHAAGWMPDVIEGKRRRQYSRASVWKALEEKRGERSTAIGLYRTTSPALDMSLRLWFPPLPPRLHVWVDVQPLSLFGGTERCLGVVDLVRAWASRYPVSHGVVHSMADRQLADFPNFGRDDETSQRDGFDKIYELFWLNVFGPKLVETVGRERMLSTPAHRVEALPNGSILLVTWPTVADFASEAAREAQARAFVHLRPDLDFATVLRTLRERSAALAPVEPRFQPDVAALLSRVPDAFAISERQRKISELNAYRPPDPEEWLPASAALPSDVEDPDRARAQYADLAERLVALLHTPVPSVFEATPESLTDIDAHFFHENFPETFQRENLDDHAVPAVGAYLGEVLVKHLGGQWIPRRKLQEAQVRVGERVWLPFVRAHRYLRSRQALLDFSLTQLYRVAERHRFPAKTGDA